MLLCQSGGIYLAVNGFDKFQMIGIDPIILKFILNPNIIIKNYVNCLNSKASV